MHRALELKAYLLALEHHEIEMADAFIEIILHPFDECLLAYHLANVFAYKQITEPHP
jgi:hypothetical protein